jgi:hypothetical protein
MGWLTPLQHISCLVCSKHGGWHESSKAALQGVRQLCRADVSQLCREAQYAGGLDTSLMLDDWNAPPTAGKWWWLQHLAVL